LKSLRVLLADDHYLVRAGLRALLEHLPGIQVVAEAGDGVEALQLVEQHAPDVVLMDVAMPRLNGVEATTRIARDFPAVRVLIVSMHANEEYVVHALRAGAAGYLLKDATPAELEQAVHAVARGETYLTPAVSAPVVEYLRRVGGEGSPLDRLTPRQREILQLVAEGYRTRDIAQRLCISQKTVETHRAQIMERLDVHDLAGLVRSAIRLGLVSPE
jgi:DNA-binding NarL/FixJ family response regulator